MSKHGTQSKDSMSPSVHSWLQSWIPKSSKWRWSNPSSRQLWKDIIRWFSRQVTVTWQLMKRATLMNRRGPFQSFMHNLSTCCLTCSIITASPQQICQPRVLQFGSHGSWHRTLSCRPDRWRGSLSILRNREKFCQRPWHQHWNRFFLETGEPGDFECQPDVSGSSQTNHQPLPYISKANFKLQNLRRDFCPLPKLSS